MSPSTMTEAEARHAFRLLPDYAQAMWDGHHRFRITLEQRYHPEDNGHRTSSPFIEHQLTAVVLARSGPEAVGIALRLASTHWLETCLEGGRALSLLRGRFQVRDEVSDDPPPGRGHLPRWRLKLCSQEEELSSEATFWHMSRGIANYLLTK